MWIINIDNIFFLFSILLHLVGGFTFTEDIKKICGSDNWTKLDLRIIQDDNDIKRLTSEKCAVNLRVPPNGRLSQKIMDLLPKHHLKLLHISGELHALDDASFPAFRSLKYLKLSDVHLDESDIFKDEGAFSKNIELLDLSRNSLSNLTFFKTESRITKIDLHDNRLETVPNELKVFKNLKELSMYKNNIRNFSLDRTLINVEFLDLSHNKISSLSGLQHFPNLIVLNLTKNFISDINEEYFENERYDLEELLLDQNSVEVIETGIFLNFPKLKIFSIEDNRLTKIIPTTEKYRNSKIEHMNLGKNSLDEIPYHFLKWFPSLKTLKINNNKLSYLRIETFAKLNRLQHLDLSNNEIVAFNVRRLIPLESLSFLDISNNKIEIIDYFSLGLYIPNLKTINIDENSLFCENLMETLFFFDNNGVEVGKGECIERENLRGICCVDSAKNYTHNKFDIASFSLIKQNQKNSEKMDKLLEIFHNATVEKDERNSLFSTQNESLIITKATFWTGLGLVLVALCLILFVLILSLVSKKKEVLPVHS